MRKKPCKVCGEVFQPERPIQPCCSIPCAIEWVEIKRDEKRKKDTRRRKSDLKTLREWIKEAQVVFNRYIRLRDKDLPCISCGRHHEGQYHAGHYKTRGAHPELAFDEKNCAKQCAPCNNHLSGNITNYRLGLIERYGIEHVEYLEGQHKCKNYTIEDAKEIKALYLRKIKELKDVQ